MMSCIHSELMHIFVAHINTDTESNSHHSIEIKLSLVYTYKYIKAQLLHSFFIEYLTDN